MTSRMSVASPGRGAGRAPVARQRHPGRRRRATIDHGRGRRLRPADRWPRTAAAGQRPAPMRRMRRMRPTRPPGRGAAVGDQNASDASAVDGARPARGALGGFIDRRRRTGRRRRLASSAGPQGHRCRLGRVGGGDPPSRSAATRPAAATVPASIGRASAARSIVVRPDGRRARRPRPRRWSGRRTSWSATAAGRPHPAGQTAARGMPANTASIDAARGRPSALSARRRASRRVARAARRLGRDHERQERTLVARRAMRPPPRRHRRCRPSASAPRPGRAARLRRARRGRPASRARRARARASRGAGADGPAGGRPGDHPTRCAGAGASSR